MKVTKWEELRESLLSAEELAEVDKQVQGELQEMELRELREMSGLTQAELAEAAEMTQPHLSKFERREDHLLSNLRRYVEALGGELEVVAVFGNRRIRLRSV